MEVVTGELTYAGTMIGYNGLTGADGVYIGDAGGNLILTNGASAYTGSLGSNKEFMLMFVYETNITKQILNGDK